MFTRNKLFFQCEIWNLLIYILYVHKKKVIFFQCRIKNFLKYSFKFHYSQYKNLKLFTCIVYIHMSCFLIFSYEILKF
jgi:hypothetical protein